MNKKIIGAVIVVFLPAISFSGFWFYKTKQTKNHIEKAIENNKQYVSAQLVTTSVSPFSQKVVVKNLALKSKLNSVVTIENIEIETSALSQVYVVKFLGGVALKHNYAGKDIDFSLEFSDDTKITISELEQGKLSVKYNGSGYKIIDNSDKSVVLETQYQGAESEFVASDTGDMFSYKYKSDSSQMFDKNKNIVTKSGVSLVDFSMLKEGDQKSSYKLNVDFKDLESVSAEYLSWIFLGVKKDPAASEPSSELNSGKINFAVNGEVNLESNGDKMVDLLPPDQMEKLPAETRAMYRSKPLMPYSVVVNLQKLEYAAPEYKIFLAADIRNYPEDMMPSGAINLEIDNFDNVVKLIKEGIQNLNSQDQQAAENFAKLQQLMDDYVNMIKDLATKNPKSVENKVAFEIKRNKGEDGMSFTINDVSFAELAEQFAKISEPVTADTEDVVNQPQVAEKIAVQKVTKQKVDKH